VQITQEENGEFFRVRVEISRPLAVVTPFRNFARTRFRDSTRRVQKDHFGRRRLGILSRSLGNGARRKDEEAAPGISSILLEHAQREISRFPTSFHATQGGPLGASTFDISSPSRSSRTGPKVTSSQVIQILDSGSCEFPRPLSPRWSGCLSKDSSLRAEMDRILEFSRTVGLCNYLNFRKRVGSASLASDVDPESEVGTVPLISLCLIKPL
jgi:hypothetical protein